jgi:hypothetical protein
MRKSLFWGLTLILVAVLVTLIIRSRRMEKEQAQPEEVVRQAFMVPTRVFAPADLEIASSTMQLKPDHTALHRIKIKNHGDVPYSGLLLRFTYQDHSGNSLLSKSYALGKAAIRPAQVFQVPEIVIMEVPPATKQFQVSIQYADMQPTGGPTVD